jgi:hypothetical protein
VAADLADDLDRALESNAFVRYLDILSVGLGVLFASLTVNPPIAAARAGQRIVFIHRSGVEAAFCCMLCGVILLVAGKNVRHFMMRKWYDARPLQICGTLLVVLAAAAFRAWFERYFSNFRFHRSKTAVNTSPTPESRGSNSAGTSG